jgi:hypothetical protein
MSLKNRVLKKYIGHDEIKHVFWYDLRVYLWTIAPYVLVLTLSYGVFLLFNYFFPTSKIPWIVMSVIWVWIYIKMLLAFTNKYLDAIIVTDNWMTKFERSWLLEYKTDTFDRGRVEAVSHEQPSLLNSLLNRWNLTVMLELWSKYDFWFISNPQKKAQIILDFKNKKIKPAPIDDQPLINDHDKFNILVETLWEVIVDYMKHDKEKSN